MSKGKKKESLNDKESFFERMKNDKKYNAKVQLFGYLIFLGALIIWVNLSSVSGNRGNVILDNNVDKENTYKDGISLLEILDDNYSYDGVISIDKISMNVDTNEEVVVTDKIRYYGKSFRDNLEINKVVNDISNLYYKKDNNYYSMVDNISSLVKDIQVYDVIEGKYIELDNILGFINKASLDHVTDYSSGKRESVYHLRVKDIILDFVGSDVIEISVVEDEGELVIDVDYSNLLKEIDASIVSCKLELIVNDIGEVEEFSVN